MQIHKCLALTTASVLTWCGTVAGRSVAAAELPVACSPCTPPTGAPINWVSSGTATRTTTATSMVINAGTAAQPNVTRNWQSFNISNGNSVQFVQPNATAVALNNIYQADPSRIFGNLSANGQVYLLNQNGIIFGNPDGSPVQINTGGLLASSLNMSADAAKNGILSPIQSEEYCRRVPRYIPRRRSAAARVSCRSTPAPRSRPPMAAVSRCSRR